MLWWLLYVQCTSARARTVIDQSIINAVIEYRKTFWHSLFQEENVCLKTRTRRQVLFRVVFIISFIRHAVPTVKFILHVHKEYHHYYYKLYNFVKSSESTGIAGAKTLANCISCIAYPILCRPLVLNNIIILYTYAYNIYIMQCKKQDGANNNIFFFT